MNTKLLKNSQIKKLLEYQKMTVSELNKLTMEQRMEKWQLEHPGQQLGYATEHKKSQKRQEFIDNVLFYHDKGFTKKQIAEILDAKEHEVYYIMNCKGIKQNR